MMTTTVSIPIPQWDDAAKSALAAIGEWVEINRRGARVLLDIVTRDATDTDVLAVLPPAANAVGAWAHGGHPQRAINDARWVQDAPDIITGGTPEAPVYGRPTQWAQVHKWLGWQDRTR